MGALAGDREDTKRLRASFPLFPAGEFDFFYKNAPWGIGLESTCPAELKRKIAGAFISEILELKSVDNVIKKYLADREYEEADYDRLDLRIRRFISSSMTLFHEGITALGKRVPQTLNCGVSGWTLVRAPFSIEQMAYCANRGALYEANAIARMMFEQLAWANYAFFEPEETDVFRRKPQACIGALKRHLWYAGLLYGWMSDHAHWSFEGHRKSATSHAGQFGQMLASTYFKIISFALMLILVDSYTKILIVMMREYGPVSEVWRTADRAESIVKQCSSLMGEIIAYCSDDEELLYLSSMLDVEGSD